MKKYSYYNLAKTKYVEASLQMLEYFKTDVIEVHHIGSSSFASLGTSEDIDVLVILKSQDQVAELPDVLIAEGYEIVDGFSPYYTNETIVRGKFDDNIYVNFIFMAQGESRKDEIINCKLYINENDEHMTQFISLKEQYNNGSLSDDEYQVQKEQLFLNIIGSNEDADVI